MFEGGQIGANRGIASESGRSYALDIAITTEGGIVRELRGLGSGVFWQERPKDRHLVDMYSGFDNDWLTRDTLHLVSRLSLTNRGPSSGTWPSIRVVHDGTTLVLRVGGQFVDGEESGAGEAAPSGVADAFADSFCISSHQR